MWTQTVDLEKWHWLDWVLGAARGMASLGDRVVMGGQCRQANPGVLCSIQRPPRIPSEEKKERKEARHRCRNVRLMSGCRAVRPRAELARIHSRIREQGMVEAGTKPKWLLGAPTDQAMPNEDGNVVVAK